jgi:acetylornithine deacetylase/succinyl-diaminopimelate desuccinylase-like protein
MTHLSPPVVNTALSFANSNRDQFVRDLSDYIAIPSVSAQPKHANDVLHAAKWLRDHLIGLGLQSWLIPSPVGGNPAVYAHWQHPDPNKPTLLIYGHYDVQPADPVALWHSPPFTATLKDGYIWGRGADDNKGQHMSHVKAVESYLKSSGALPCSVKFIVEGEEEVGGESLPKIIADNTELLACDAVMVSDSGLISLQQPSLVYGLRGLVYFEVEARVAKADMHSGHYGGNIQNPIMALAQILAQLKDKQGHILVPGFYDAVRVMNDEERTELARVPLTDELMKAETGAPMTFGEPEFNVTERMGARPTLEINGMWGGYIEAGEKTVLPATAHAKMSCRLVPYQDPIQVYQLVRDFMQSLAGGELTLSFHLFSEGAKGTLINRQSPAIQAAMHAAEETYGNRPIFTLEGGSIPVVNDFQQILGKPVVLLGFGLNDDNLHAPNERFAIACYEKGTEASIRYLSAFAAAYSASS